jgi:photosystem II stability/assembly factor-like uncharacterized protein
VTTRPVDSTNIHGVTWANATTAYAFGQTGHILKSTNGGVDWTLQTAPGTANLEDGSCISATACWTTGASGAIYATSNGSTWAAQTSGTVNGMKGIAALDATHVWAVGASGTILFYNGTSWAAQTSGTATNLRGVTFVNASNGWAVGASGLIRVTTNGGSSWSTQTSGVIGNLNTIACTDASHCWVATDADGVLVYNGTSWSGQTLDANANKCQTLAFWDANTGLIGCDGTKNAPPIDLQLTQNGGTSWIPLENQNIEFRFSPTVASGAAVTTVKATITYKCSVAPVAPAKFWLLASPDAGASWKYYSLAGGTTSTTTATVDLSSLVDTGTKVQNLQVRFYVSLGAFSTIHDLVQVQVN